MLYNICLVPLSYKYAASAFRLIFFLYHDLIWFTSNKYQTHWTCHSIPINTYNCIYGSILSMYFTPFVFHYRVFHTTQCLNLNKISNHTAFDYTFQRITFMPLCLNSLYIHLNESRFHSDSNLKQKKTFGWFLATCNWTKVSIR